MNTKILIIGPKDSDVTKIIVEVKNHPHILCRVMDLSDLSELAVTKYGPDIMLFNLGPNPDVYIKMHDRIAREDTMKDTPIIVAVDESRILDAAKTLPTQIFTIVSKPLRPLEILAKINLIYRQTHRISDKSIIRAGELEIDITKYEVRVEGCKIDLTYTEYELLRFLASHPCQVFGRDLLLNKVWGYDYFGGARTVDVHVRRLRSKIEKNNTRFIETIRHIGYKFTNLDE